MRGRYLGRVGQHKSREPEFGYVHMSPFGTVYCFATTVAVMAPKKKSGTSAHPSTSKAPPPTASNAVGDAEACETVNAAGDVVGVGGAITTSPASDMGVGDIGGE